MKMDPKPEKSIWRILLEEVLVQLSRRSLSIRQAHADNLQLRVAAAEERRLHRRVSVVDYEDSFLKNVCHSTIRTVICLEGILGLEGMQCWLSFPRFFKGLSPLL